MIRSRRSFRPIEKVPQKQQTRPIMLYAPVYNGISAAFAFSSSSPLKSHLLTFPSSPHRPWPSHTPYRILPGRQLHSFRLLCSHASSLVCLFGLNPTKYQIRIFPAAKSFLYATPFPLPGSYILSDVAFRLRMLVPIFSQLSLPLKSIPSVSYFGSIQIILLPVLSWMVCVRASGCAQVLLWMVTL
ncbi:hypothetical protein F4604DRAFT_1705295 [Suillus subluteus]|nr:hypothetical protein F4604DRAFT_1705295 [Suillus subluteus]